jgi:hypothetical protein
MNSKLDSNDALNTYAKLTDFNTLQQTVQGLPNSTNIQTIVDEYVSTMTFTNVYTKQEIDTNLQDNYYIKTEIDGFLDLKASQSDFTTLETTVAGKADNGDLINLIERVDTVETTLLSNSGTLTTLSSNYDNLNDTISNINNNISSINGSITTFDSSITELQTSKANYSDITDLVNNNTLTSSISLAKQEVLATFNSSLTDLVSMSTLTSSLDLKAEQSEVTNLATLVEGKANISDLDSKTSKTYVDTAIASLESELTNLLDDKISSSVYNTDLANKADISDLDGKVDNVTLETTLVSYYTKTQVDSAISAKENDIKSYIDQGISTKIDLATVNSIISDKASITYVNDSVSNISSIIGNLVSQTQLEEFTTNTVSLTSYNTKITELEDAIADKQDAGTYITDLALKADKATLQNLDDYVDTVVGNNIDSTYGFLSIEKLITYIKYLESRIEALETANNITPAANPLTPSNP